MLTDGTGGSNSASGSNGDSLLEELNRDEESHENTCTDDDINIDDKQAWINAQWYIALLCSMFNKFVYYFYY